MTASDVQKILNLKHAWEFILDRNVIASRTDYYMLCHIARLVNEGFFDQGGHYPLTLPKATYDEIKKYVAEHNAGMKVSNLYISQVKRKCGIEVGKNYNLPENEDSGQPQCRENKERAIEEALEHFKMI